MNSHVHEKNIRNKHQKLILVHLILFKPNKVSMWMWHKVMDNDSTDIVTLAAAMAVQTIATLTLVYHTMTIYAMLAPHQVLCHQEQIRGRLLQVILGLQQLVLEQLISILLHQTLSLVILRQHGMITLHKLKQLLIFQQVYHFEKRIHFR